MKTTNQPTDKKFGKFSESRLWKTLLWQCLLPSLIGVVCLSSPAEASRLQNWRFQPGQNQLSFRTASAVQPKAQLISDPVRLVIDLPGISIADIPRNLRSQSIRGAIREVRVGQVETNMARIVVELADGYTLDPSGVKFEPVSGNNWTVQLPDPQPINAAARPSVAVSSGEKRSPEITQGNGFATIESVQLVNNGTQLVIRSDRPIQYNASWDRQTLDYAIQIFSAQLGEGVNLPSGFTANNPILSLQEREDEPETVTLMVQPNPNYHVMGVVSQGANQIALQLQPKAGASGSGQGSGSSSTAPLPPENYPQIEARRPQDGRLVVVIDPGHGGSDPGAVGLGGLRETDVVLDVSQKLAQILEQNGLQVVMTRQDERTIDLAPRTQLANRISADLFVSIHANAVGGGRTEVNGVETYYYQSGNLLAQYIQNSILQTMRMNNRGVKQARFYVLRNTQMPAVLVETGFVTGSDDSQILANPDDRTRMAEAIARGILQYVQRTR
jgi:N-acetylmuramoyl-L-alanine amidase